MRPRIAIYQAESLEIMAIVRTFSGELIQQVSIDEAYLDVSSKCDGTSAEARMAAAVPLARAIKKSIHDTRKLTATIGIAPNKLLAKLASDFQKPDGLTVVRESEKRAFLRPLPVRSLHGVGTVTEEALALAGIRTVGDLQDYRGDLRALVGSWGTQLKQFAFGEDERPLNLGEEVKSISSENTFPRDTDHRPTLRRCLREQAQELASKLAGQRLAAHTVQVKIRYGDFRTLTRQISFEEPLDEARQIYRLGCWLLAREKLVNRPLRLIGLGVTALTERQARQLGLTF